MRADDILFEPIKKEPETPKEEFLITKCYIHQFDLTSGHCLKCGLGLADYMYDSKPCPS